MTVACPSRFGLPLLALLAWIAVGGSAGAVCLDLARKAERMFAIPSPILQSIVEVESGDNPLALNIGGQAVFPASRAEAAALIRGNMRTANVDVGCGQISMKYHSVFFAPSPEMALDPWINVVYMSREILAGYRRTGSWAEAVATYHSSTPDRKRSYLCKVARDIQRRTAAPQSRLSGCS